MPSSRYFIEQAERKWAARAARHGRHESIALAAVADPQASSAEKALAQIILDLLQRG